MGKKIGVDTVVFIYLFEGAGVHAKRAEEVLNRVEHGMFEAVFSSIGIIEILTGPKKLGQPELAAQYKNHLARFPHLTIMGINERIVDIASDLRARYGISTPDAIHVATALDFGAEKFITNDRSLRKIKEITIELL